MVSKVFATVCQVVARLLLGGFYGIQGARSCLRWLFGGCWVVAIPGDYHVYAVPGGCKVVAKHLLRNLNWLLAL